MRARESLWIRRKFPLDSLNHEDKSSNDHASRETFNPALVPSSEENFTLGAAKTKKSSAKLRKRNRQRQGTPLPISPLVTPQIPIGWDYKKTEWYAPIWPKLDSNLGLSMDGKTTKWKLDWEKYGDGNV